MPFLFLFSTRVTQCVRSPLYSWEIMLSCHDTSFQSNSRQLCVLIENTSGFTKSPQSPAFDAIKLSFGYGIYHIFAVSHKQKKKKKWILSVSTHIPTSGSSACVLVAFGVAATVSAVASIISPSLCLSVFPHVGRPANQANHLENHSFILASNASPILPHWDVTMATGYDWQTTRQRNYGAVVNLEASQHERTIVVSELRLGTWSQRGEWKDKVKSLRTDSGSTIWSVSHFFWLKTNDTSKKPVVDVEAGDFVLSPQNHD